MVDTRVAIREFLNPLEFSSWRALGKFAGSLLFASLVAYYPEYAGLSDGARGALFILLLSASLWITEAIPAFAVGLLVMGLNIAILGRAGGGIGATIDDWERYIAVWGSPLIWLFFGGFVLARAAEKIRLTDWLALNVLQRLGTRPTHQLLGCMAVTFTFSMFVSNTATATMMVAVLMPVLQSIPQEDRFRKGLVLGIAFAANLGGMGTVIGSPPNAIAAGALHDVRPIDFAGWMLAGLPPALLLLAIAWGYLVFRYPSATGSIDMSALGRSAAQPSKVARWRRIAVIVVFVTTIGLWLTTSFHHLPATVIAFVPTCALTTLGVLDANDIRTIRWDVLLLIAGGLSLGVAVSHTGLAEWMLAHLALENVSAFGLALVFTTATVVLSNVMSNTAAANILVPVAIAASAGFEAVTVVPLALGASAAMCLPISTPPNAIVYGTGELETKEMLLGGLLIALLAPLIATGWCWLVLAV